MSDLQQSQATKDDGQQANDQQLGDTQHQTDDVMTGSQTHSQSKKGEEEEPGENRVPHARFSKVIEERNKARAKIEELESKMKEIAKPNSEKKDRLAELERQLEELQQTADRERMARLKLEVATEAKLPTKLAERLKGKDRDELLADALSLVEALPETPVGSLPRGSLTPKPEITSEQLNDPEWVKKNTSQIFKAMKDGTLPV